MFKTWYQFIFGNTWSELNLCLVQDDDIGGEHIVAFAEEADVGKRTNTCPNRQKFLYLTELNLQNSAWA